jgi:phenylacetate-CoA ligase
MSIFFTPRESWHWLKALWSHRRNLRVSRERLLRDQVKKFHRLVAFVNEKSPYYRRIIRERGIDPKNCQPTDFPKLTKREVVDNFDEIVTDRRITRKRISEYLAHSTDPNDLFEGCFHVLHTSGTSGTMGYYVFSHEAWIRGASQVVRVAPPRWRRRTAFVAATRGHFAGSSLIQTGNHGTNRLFYDVRTFDVGQPMPQIVAALNEFQPHALSGYAAILKVLAEAQERGELRINPRMLGNGGEPLLPDIKAYVERVFRVPVNNAYASSEHLYMGLTLPKTDGMLLLEDDLIFELESDHTCVTNLFNETTPLIRYRMDDVLVRDTTSENPYPFTKVKDVVGRYEDALMFMNRRGKLDFIHPIVIVELAIKGLNAWQVVLEGHTSFRFRARLESGLTSSEREETLNRIRAKMDAILAEKEMDNVRFEIELVDEISLDPMSGKFRLVIREPDQAAGKADRSVVSSSSAAAA